MGNRRRYSNTSLSMHHKRMLINIANNSKEYKRKDLLRLFKAVSGAMVTEQKHVVHVRFKNAQGSFGQGKATSPEKQTKFSRNNHRHSRLQCSLKAISLAILKTALDPS